MRLFFEAARGLHFVVVEPMTVILVIDRDGRVCKLVLLHIFSKVNWYGHSHRSILLAILVRGTLSDHLLSGSRGLDANRHVVSMVDYLLSRRPVRLLRHVLIFFDSRVELIVWRSGA